MSNLFAPLLRVVLINSSIVCFLWQTFFNIGHEQKNTKMDANIVSVKLLLGIIAALAGGQLIILGFFARKYIREIDNISSAMNKIKTEHLIFHKDETGMK